MTDKVRKIREWVKARLDENASKQSLPQFYGMMEEDARFLDFLDSIQEEPVSEGLEKEILKTTKMVKHLDLSIDDIVSFCAHHYSKWQEEQMMKDAYDAYVSYIRDNSEAVVHLNNTSITMPCYFPKRDLEEGDKLKVIVIKED